MLKQIVSGCVFIFSSIVAAEVTAQTWYRQNGGIVTQSNETYYTSLSDTLGVYVYNSGIYTLTNSRVHKTGNTSNIDSSDFYGRNAAVLAKTGGITLNNDSVTTNGIGVNAAFACMAGSSLILNNDTFSSSGNYSHGIEATVGASITATNCIIYTTGGIGASAIATDCGGGIINVTGGSANTQQLLAAAIYSTGTVTATGTALTTLLENTCVIDGRNSIYLTNCTLNAGLNGLKIYESAPGDTAHGTAQITMSGGTLTATGHAFYIDGNNSTRATVVVKGGTIVSTGTGYIVYADSAGNTNFTADGETLTGNIFADSTAFAVDTLATTLQNSTTLNGIITHSSLTIAATSKWNVTGDSHIETLADASGVNTSSLTVSNIIGNGYSVFYKPGLAGNSWLGGNTYTLSNGGCLLPEGATCTNTGVQLVSAESAKIEIYPNPVSNYLLVSYPSVYDNATVKIMSMDGRIIDTGILKPGASVAIIDMKGIASGTYIVIVEGSAGKAVIKFNKN